MIPLASWPVSVASIAGSSRRPFVVGPDEGASYQLGNSTQTLKVRAEDTSGHFELWETWLPPGYQGPSPHVYDRLDKAFYVTEGEVEFLVGDRVERGSPGSV